MWKKRDIRFCFLVGSTAVRVAVRSYVGVAMEETFCIAVGCGQTFVCGAVGLFFLFDAFGVCVSCV